MATKKPVLKSTLAGGQGTPIDPALFPPSSTPGNVLGQMGIPAAPVTNPSLVQQLTEDGTPIASNFFDAAAAAPEATGLLSRLKGILPDVAFGGKAAAGKGTGVAVAASAAAPFAGKLASNFFGDQAGTDVQDALTGAGIGGGVGSMFGLGIPGALIGGLGGALYGQFHHDNGQSVGDKIIGQLTAFGVNPMLAHQITSKYNELAKQDKASAQDWVTGQLGEAQAQFKANNDLLGGGAGGGGATPEQNLVLQQLAGQAMAPYVNDMRSNLDSSANAVKISMGKNLTPEQSARMAPLVTQYANLSKNVADAYALQAEQFPIQNQLAKSAWATMLQASSGSGGGGLTNLLAQTTPSTANPNAYSATT